jgi:hypothetical protein
VRRQLDQESKKVRDDRGAPLVIERGGEKGWWPGWVCGVGTAVRLLRKADPKSVRVFYK